MFGKKKLKQKIMQLEAENAEQKSELMKLKSAKALSIYKNHRIRRHTSKHRVFLAGIIIGSLFTCIAVKDDNL